MRKIETVEALSALYDEAVPAAIVKVATRLTPLYREWIEGSRFCILSTVGRDGVHGSPRGDAGPVVRVEDERTLMMPDWRGNNRLDCLKDIVEDGRVALLFLVPGSNTTVRVNGRAVLTDDEGLEAGICAQVDPAGDGDRDRGGRGLHPMRQGVAALGPVDAGRPRDGADGWVRSWRTCRMARWAGRPMIGITRRTPQPRMW